MIPSKEPARPPTTTDTHGKRSAQTGQQDRTEASGIVTRMGREYRPGGNAVEPARMSSFLVDYTGPHEELGIPPL